ncbi:unnamed protein product [Enterobius vermicularis]|uniref:G patch domain-containing protein 11 n=1 Tax=Enterobius vermicularis TaxID=51028 RepID=A0A0N4VGN7_ENTVE|nr:unnamed protein product [Enterobius vermicularis]
MDMPTSIAESGSESEEDYMSEAFIASVSNVRPGLARTVYEQRALRIEASKQENIQRLRSLPRLADLEKEKRDEGLAKPVGEGSKGFALLQKMGYKPGMSLGVKRDGTNEGIKEPIGVNIKTGRTGLGHEKEEESKKKFQAELLLKASLARSKANVHSDFRKRKRAAKIQKQIFADLMKSRKACEDLDVRKGIKDPLEPEFWPIYESKDEANCSQHSKRILLDHTDSEPIFRYSNGKLAPSEVRLEGITSYLRKEHLYCTWCGYQYDSVDDMETQCPGNTRDAHENDSGD